MDGRSKLSNKKQVAVSRWTTERHKHSPPARLRQRRPAPLGRGLPCSGRQPAPVGRGLPSSGRQLAPGERQAPFGDPVCCKTDRSSAVRDSAKTKQQATETTANKENTHRPRLLDLHLRSGFGRGDGPGDGHPLPLHLALLDGQRRRRVGEPPEQTLCEEWTADRSSATKQAALSM